MTAEFATARARSHVFMSYGHDTPRKPCPACGQRFFTNTGLDEHIRLGQHSNNDLVIRRIGEPSGPEPTGRTQVEQGRRIAALNNARRRSCHGCDLVTTPAALGVHQKASGHTGWTEVTP